MMMSFKRLPFLVYLRCLFICLLSRIPLIQCSSSGAEGSGGGIYGGRHSYSLSTFSPSGNLDQVVRAIRASMLGVPIVALSIPSVTSAEIRDGRVKSADSEIISSLSSSNEVAATPVSPNSHSTPLSPRGGIYLSIPLRFLTTSPFLLDDGTPRIVQVTSTICIAHTGVGADGRALCDVAVKLALDYRYIYGEEISLEELLEGIAENIQERTMKGGSRPYGCALLIGCLGSGDNGGQPMMYRVDPSGAVVLLNPVSYEETSRETTTTIEGSAKRRRGSVAFLGNWDPLRQKKDAIRSQLEKQQFANEEELHDVLVDVARQTYVDEMPLSEGSVLQTTKKRLNQPVLFASFTHEYGLHMRRDCKYFVLQGNQK